MVDATQLSREKGRGSRQLSLTKIVAEKLLFELKERERERDVLIYLDASLIHDPGL